MTSMTAMPALLEFELFDWARGLAKPETFRLSPSSNSTFSRNKASVLDGDALSADATGLDQPGYQISWGPWVKNLQLVASPTGSGQSKHALHDKFDNLIYESSMEESRERR